MTITLPDDLRDELERRAKAGGFGSVEEFVVSLIVGTDEPEPGPLTAHTPEEVRSKILEGLASGPPVEVTPAFWEERQRVLATRRAARRTGPS